MPDVAALLTQLVSAFSTPTGMGVAVLAALAIVGFGVVVFWDNLSPRGGGSLGLPKMSPPPRLEAPQMLNNKPERFWDAGKSRFMMSTMRGIGVLGVVAALVMLVGFPSIGGGKGDTAELNDETVIDKPTFLASLAEEEGESHANSFNTPFCQMAGSVQARFVEFCANGSAVRMDLVRFQLEGRFVVEPRWSADDLALVTSESHATPFSMSAVAGFDAPLTSGRRDYDGFLVVGVADGASVNDTAEMRRMALEQFAAFQLCGINGLDCPLSDSVFSATGELLDGYTAEPIMVGIRIDPLSPTPMADMHVAASCFLKQHGAALGLRANSPVMGGGDHVDASQRVPDCN